MTRLGAIRIITVIAAIGMCLLAVGLLVAFHAATFNENWTDENIYLYQAGRLADGAVLYRDIPSSRPPLALAPLAALLAVGVPPLLSARAAVVLLQFATAALLLWFGRRQWGAMVGVAAFALLVVSLTGQRVYTAMDAVVLGTTAAVVLALAGRPWAAGVAGGLALATGQHAIVLVALSGLVLLVRRRADGLRFFVGSGATAAVVYGLALLVGGADAWDYLVGHHLFHLGGSVADIPPLGPELTIWALERFPLLALGLVALLVPGTSRGTSRDQEARPWRAAFTPERLLAVMALAQVLCVAVMQGGLILYVHPAVPLLALLAGVGVQRLWNAIKGLRREQDDTSADQPTRLLAGLAVASFALVVAGVLVAGTAASAKLAKRDHEDYSVIPALRHVTMAEVQDLVVARKIADHVAQVTTPDQTIFGYATILGTVATLSDRQVAAELADLAPRWMELGIVSQQEVIEDIEADDVQVFVTPRWFYVKDPTFRAYLQGCYATPTVFEREPGPGRGIPDILVFEHLDGARPCMPDGLGDAPVATNDASDIDTGEAHMSFSGPDLMLACGTPGQRQ